MFFKPPRRFNLPLLLALTFFSGNVWAFPPSIPQISSFLHNRFEFTNQHWCVSQHPENSYVYFGTSEGLIEFNGITLKKYVLDLNRPVRSVLAMPDGPIYTGTFEEFGYWQHNNAGQLEYTSLSDNTDMESNDEIWKIYSEGNDVLFQSFTSIYRLRNGAVQKIKAPYTLLFLHHIYDQFVVQILENGLFWFENDEYVLIENSEVFADKKVHSIIPYLNNHWLVCTDNNGLYLYDGNRFMPFNSEASDFLQAFSCNAALNLNDSSFVFGSILNGLIIADQYGNIHRSYNTNNGLNGNTVLSLFLDEDGGLWVGLDEGANYINLQSPYTHYTPLNGTLGTIYAMLLKDDYLYIGTNHGLFRTRINRRGHIYSFADPEIIKGSQGQVWALGEFDGQIICGHNDGTFVVNNDRLEQISSITGGWSYTQFGEYILAGTYTGLVILEKAPSGKWKFRNKVDGFNEPIRYIETDYLGYVWASHHQKGTYKIELSGNLDSVATFEAISNDSAQNLNMRVFKVNNRVVFTTGSNIYTWDFVRNEVVEFESLTGQISEYRTANQILHFRKNQYWFITKDKMGLFEINIDFTAKKLLEIPQRITNLPQRRLQLVSFDDDIFIKPNQQNFDVFNMALAQNLGLPYRLSIEKMIFYNAKDTLQWYKNAPKKALPARINNLMVYVADPSRFSEFPKTFYYRIKELDNAWQSSTQGPLTYLDLKHGDYTLEIAPQPGDDGAMVAFSIARPWYISTIAYVIYLILFFAAVWGLLLLFRFEVNRQKELVALEIRQNSLEKELDYKSYELMLTMRHLMLKDDILNDLQKQIEALKDKSSKYPIKYIREMEKIISQGLGTQNVEWENAMKSLKLSQQGFFKVLKEKYPELTSNDLRLCSYLRLNFNSKEIARLLNISIRSVEISRHRLRKKLNLSSEQNLFDFLMQIEADSDENPLHSESHKAFL